jgi:hypothetical protein
MIPEFAAINQRLRLLASLPARCKRFLAFDDRRANGCHFTIQVDEILPLIRHIVFMVNCLDGALRSARIAIKAANWVNEQHLLTLAKAVGRANDHAVCVFAAETRFGYHKSHDILSGRGK